MTGILLFQGLLLDKVRGITSTSPYRESSTKQSSLQTPVELPVDSKTIRTVKQISQMIH